jgi:hypothetical protein
MRSEEEYGDRKEDESKYYMAFPFNMNKFILILSYFRYKSNQLYMYQLIKPSKQPYTACDIIIPRQMRKLRHGLPKYRQPASEEVWLQRPLSVPGVSKLQPIVQICPAACCCK